MSKKSFWIGIGSVLIVGFMLGFAFGPQSELMGRATSAVQLVAAMQSTSATPANEPAAQACLQLHDTPAMQQMHNSMGPHAMTGGMMSGAMTGGMMSGAMTGGMMSGGSR